VDEQQLTPHLQQQPLVVHYRSFPTSLTPFNYRDIFRLSFRHSNLSSHPSVSHTSTASRSLLSARDSVAHLASACLCHTFFTRPIPAINKDGSYTTHHHVGIPGHICEVCLHRRTSSRAPRDPPQRHHHHHHCRLNYDDF
jgi:hypothetical protein